MAKITPQFQSAQEKDKWKSLQDQAGQSLAKIAQGKANAPDLQRVSQVLGSMSKLAQSVFDDAVTSAEKQAKSITEAGNIKIKEGLTAFETAVNERLQEFMPTLMSSIKEALSLELLQQSEDLYKSLGSKITDIQSLLPPKDLPTTDDLLASNELLIEHLDTKEKGLIAKIQEMFQETLNSALSGAKGPSNSLATTSSRYAKGGRHVMNPYEIKPNLATKAGSMVGDTNVVDVDATTVPTGSMLPKGPEGTGTTPLTPALPENTDADIDNAAKNQTSLLSRIGQLLKGLIPGKGAGKSDEDFTEKEGKKADTWWRSFKGFFGDIGKKAKNSAGSGGWLKLLGAGLMSMILAPQMWAALGRKLKEYVTLENITKVISGAWDFIKTKGGELISFVWDKLKNLPYKQIANWIEGVATSLWDKIKSIFPGQKLKKAAKDAGQVIKDGAVSLYHKVVDSLTPGGGTTKPGVKATTTPGPAGKPPTGPGAAPSSSTPFNFTLPASKGGTGTTPSTTTNKNAYNFKTSVVNANGVSNLGGKTVSVGDTAINYAPGVTTPVPGAPGKAAPGAPGNKGGVQGTPPVGLGTFPIQSATDDTLILMNSSFLGY